MNNTTNQVPVTSPAWAEYDSAAKYLADKGLTGAPGDPLPALLSTEVHNLVNDDIEAFQQRVNDFAYANSMNNTTNNLLPEPMIYAEPIQVCFTFEDYVKAAEHDQLRVSASSTDGENWVIFTESPTGYLNSLRLKDAQGMEWQSANSEDQAWEWAYNHFKQTGYTGGDNSNFYTIKDLEGFISQAQEYEEPYRYEDDLRSELQAAIDERGKA